MSLDPTHKASWKAHESELRGRLAAGDLSGAQTLVDATRAHLWLGMQDSDFVAHAILTMVLTGRDADALDLVRQAKRYGYPRFWYFASASTALSPEQRTVFLPIHAHAAIADFVRENFSPVVTPWGFDLTWTPLCWGEETLAPRKDGRCELTGRRIGKGEPVYALRYFNGSFDIPTELALVAPSAWADNTEARANRSKFENDAYDLESFAFKVGYSHPLVNAFWYDRARFDLRTAIAMIASPVPAVADNGMSSVFDGINGELIDLLWVLVKCGHLPAIMAMLPELPPHFPLLLAMFARDSIRSAMADHLEIPELAHAYRLVGAGRGRTTHHAELARFGAAHPAFQEQLAISLRLYGYHRYDNYQCSPNWFFQDFRYLVRAGGGDFLHMLPPGTAIDRS